MSKKHHAIGGPSGLMKHNGKFATFDAAEHTSDTDTAITKLFEQYEKDLTEWERNYLSDVYGRSPLTRKQHIKVFKIRKRLEKLNSPPVDVAAGSST